MGQTDYLGTDDLRDELERRSTRGGIVVVGRAAQVAVFLVSAMVMARLLTPRDFGPYAMVASLATFVAPFRDFGIPMATVQRKHLDQREASGLVILWWACQCRPDRPPGRSGEHAPGVRQMLAYGGNYTAYRFVHNVGYGLDRVLIGYFAGATAMGLYDNAFRWSRYPQEMLSTPLLNVAVSGLSRVQDDRDSYRAASRRGRPWSDAAPVLQLGANLTAFASLYAASWLLEPGGREAISELVGVVARHLRGRSATGRSAESG